MALNPNYVIAPSLEMYFVDKDTGLPLVAGEVFFFKDNERTIPKDVFKITGSPPNYSYDVLPNPSVLSSVGTFQDDDNNDIIPYYYPLDANGNIELYYIEVYSSEGVLQFTREGWPNFTSEQVDSNQDVTNFVPNGQFLLHNDIPAWDGNDFNAGEVSEDVTIIAQGGWTFERTAMSTATDIVTFPRYGSSISEPSGNPRYAVQIQTTVAGSDTRKDLCLKYPDVNTFASDTQEYNLYFEAQSISGSIDNVQIIIRKFFGSGGSATDEIVIDAITLESDLQSYNIPMLFGTNSGSTIGDNDDDYVQICVRLPPTGTQNALFTDFAITVNDELLLSFPEQTNAQQLDPSTAGWLPTPAADGSDLYLPLVLTPSGLTYDNTVVGKIVASTSIVPEVGELKCDGSEYRTDDYSSDGIPYARLQAKLLNGSTPIFGTGSGFVTLTQSSGASSNFIYSTNIFGSATAPTDGVTATGFTFTSIHAPSTLGYGLKAYQYQSNGFYVRSTVTGSVTAPTAGTSGFTITDIRNLASVSTAHLFSVQTLAASGLAGTYFTFTSNNPTPINYYVWFKVSGSGADPAPGGTGIEVDLLSNMSAQDVAVAVLYALNGGRQYVISCTAASSITTGSYFTFGTTNSNSYYVWYKKDGSGVDPLVMGSTLGVEVDILTADSAATVATKTIAAVNSAYFAVPDFRGMFLRGLDPNGTSGGWDFEAGVRFGMIPGIYGALIGTFEFDQNVSHNHSASSSSATSGTLTVPRGLNYSAPLSTNILTNDIQSGTVALNNFALTTTTTTSVGFNGGQEANPVNAYVYWMIKY